MGLRGPLAIAVVGLLAAFCGVVGNGEEVGADPWFKPVDYAFYCPPATLDQCGDYCYFANCEVCAQCCRDCEEEYPSGVCKEEREVTGPDGKVLLDEHGNPVTEEVNIVCTAPRCECETLNRAPEVGVTHEMTNDVPWVCNGHCEHCDPCIRWAWHIRPASGAIIKLPEDWDITPGPVYIYTNQTECDVTAMEFPLSEEYLEACPDGVGGAPNRMGVDEDVLLELGGGLPEYNCKDDDSNTIGMPGLSVPGYLDLEEELKVIQVFTAGSWPGGYNISHIGFGMTGVDRQSSAGLSAEVWEYRDELFRNEADV